MCLHKSRKTIKITHTKHYNQNIVVKLLVKQIKEWVNNPHGKDFDVFLKEFAEDINNTIPAETITLPHFEERLTRFALFASGQELLTLPENSKGKDLQQITSNFRDRICDILKTKGVDPEIFKNEFDEAFADLNKDITDTSEKWENFHFRLLELFITRYEELYQETVSKYEKLLRDKEAKLAEMVRDLKDRNRLIQKLKERLTLHELGVGSLPPKRYMYPTMVIEMAILSVVYAKSSLRGAVKILEIVKEMVVNFKHDAPSHVTVAEWLQKTAFSIYRDNSKEWMVRQGYYIIFDTSVSVGSEKLLIILAIPTMIRKKRALKATDVIIAYMKSASSWDHEKVMEAVREVSEKYGREPDYCVSDNGSELKTAMQVMNIPRHRDLSHTAANFLETVFTNCKDFNEFSAVCGKTRKFYLSNYGYLMAPSARTKARFMNIFIPVFWASTILDNYYKFNTFERYMYGPILKYAYLIDELMEIEQVYNSIFKVIKNNGLCQWTYDLCVRIIQTSLCSGTSRQREIASLLFSYFDTEMEIVNQDTKRHREAGEEHYEAVHELSSDIIESLFGTMKRVMPESKFFGLTKNCLTLNLYTVIEKPSDIHGLDVYKRLSQKTATCTQVDLWQKGGNIGPSLLGKRKGILNTQVPKIIYVA